MHLIYSVNLVILTELSESLPNRHILSLNVDLTFQEVLPGCKEGSLEQSTIKDSIVDLTGSEMWWEQGLSSRLSFTAGVLLLA